MPVHCRLAVGAACPVELGKLLVDQRRPVPLQFFGNGLFDVLPKVQRRPAHPRRCVRSTGQRHWKSD
jgi:hypothetical protein